MVNDNHRREESPTFTSRRLNPATPRIYQFLGGFVKRELGKARLSVAKLRHPAFVAPSPQRNAPAHYSSNA